MCEQFWCMLIFMSNLSSCGLIERISRLFKSNSYLKHWQIQVGKAAYLRNALTFAISTLGTVAFIILVNDAPEALIAGSHILQINPWRLHIGRIMLNTHCDDRKTPS